MSRTTTVIVGVVTGLGLIYFGIITPILRAIEMSEAPDKVGGAASRMFSHFTFEGLFLAGLGTVVLLAAVSHLWLPSLAARFGYGDDDLLQVAHLRSELVDLRDRPVGSEAEYKIWEPEIDALREKIVAVIGQRSAPYAELFRIVGNPPVVSGGFNDQHNKWIAAAYRDVDRLEDYIRSPPTRSVVRSLDRTKAKPASAKPVTATQPAPPIVDERPLPDWPIRELFFHVVPQILDEPYLSNWEVIGRQLLDCLSVGQLQAWGRVYEGSPADTERKSRLVEIDRTYWEGADFTYMFFAEQFAEHTFERKRSSLPSYADLHVNKALALKVNWTFKKPPEMVPVLEAAKMANEQAKGTPIENVAERQREREGDDGLITWFCWLLWERIPLYGSRGPSDHTDRVRSHIKDTHQFVVQGHEVVLQERNGTGTFIDLRFVKDDLQTAIEDIRDQVNP